MAAALVAHVCGRGICGVPGVPNGNLQALGFFQGTGGHGGGDVHLGAKAAVVVNPLGVLAVEADAPQRPGIAQLVVLVHLQIQVVSGPVWH